MKLLPLSASILPNPIPFVQRSFLNSPLCFFQGCGSRDLVLVSRPIKTTFLRSWSRPCWSRSWSRPVWSWSWRVVLSKTWGYVQPQRYLCQKPKLASECTPLFTYLLFDRPISMFLCIITFTAVQYSNVDEWKLFVCAGRDQDSKGLGLGLSGLGLGLGLSLSGLGLVLVSDSLVLITSLLNIYEREVFAKCADILCFYSIFQCLLSYFLLEWYFSTDF